ncbi:MAG: outer membrane beta-barrel protein [Candidatus Sulfotelmatobacter sp.]
MARITAVLFALFLLAAPALAQVPTSNVFFGYSYYNTNFSNMGRANLNGWEGSLERKIFPGVGIVADFSGQYGSQKFTPPSNPCPSGGPCPSGYNIHAFEGMFGPRFSAPLGKFRPFAEFEFGFGHASINGIISDTSFAAASGGGLDYRIIRPIALRFQGDYVSTHLFNAYQSSLRLSTGLVVRF